MFGRAKLLQTARGEREIGAIAGVLAGCVRAVVMALIAASYESEMCGFPARPFMSHNELVILFPLTVIGNNSRSGSVGVNSCAGRQRSRQISIGGCRGRPA